MGNDHPCQVVDIRSVRIMMFDGIVRTLTNVRYIPEMKKNLISLGVLDTNNHRWSIADGVLQVKARVKLF